MTIHNNIAPYTQHHHESPTHNTTTSNNDQREQTQNNDSTTAATTISMRTENSSNHQSSYIGTSAKTATATISKLRGSRRDANNQPNDTEGVEEKKNGVDLKIQLVISMITLRH